MTKETVPMIDDGTRATLSALAFAFTGATLFATPLATIDEMNTRPAAEETAPTEKLKDYARRETADGES